MAKKQVTPIEAPTTPPQKQQQQDIGRGQTAADITPSGTTSDERGPSGADINQHE